MVIIDRLSDGPLRFRDLEREVVGVNTSTLTNRLKKMRASMLIKRTELSRVDVFYELTELGNQAKPILEAANAFSEFTEKHHLAVMAKK